MDASYAAHDDMRGHTGDTMSMGCGLILSITKKKNLNTKILNEAELIGLDYALPQMLWKNYFIESQGYDINKKTLFTKKI